MNNVGKENHAIDIECLKYYQLIFTPEKVLLRWLSILCSNRLQEVTISDCKKGGDLKRDSDSMIFNISNGLKLITINASVNLTFISNGYLCISSDSIAKWPGLASPVLHMAKVLWATQNQGISVSRMPSIFE